jgi:hypothetical protein
LRDEREGDLAGADGLRAYVVANRMRIFTCSSCQQVVFFENVQCTNCGHLLGYLPDLHILSALERTDDSTGPLLATTELVALTPSAKGAKYRLCLNGVEHAACNWMIPAEDAHERCPACVLNSVIPNLEQPEALIAWRKLESSKRRLYYTLDELGLPIESREVRPENGLTFAFMSDGSDGKDKVLTGHADGLITININEADDPFREQVRKNMGEAYRTLLGHFRHEVGHYYWDRLINNTEWLARYRALFGDERADYAASMQRHYEQGAPPDWRLSFVSAYATMHPWEDWAETWSHYLHMVDTLGTARSYGLSLRPKPTGGVAELQVATRKLDFDDFDDLIAGWVPLTVALNSLNRSMGLFDPYPFVLSDMAISKLRFVHDVVEYWNASPKALARALARWPAAEEPESQPETSPSADDASPPAVTTEPEELRVATASASGAMTSEGAPASPGSEPSGASAEAKPAAETATIKVGHTVEAGGASDTQR